MYVPLDRSEEDWSFLKDPELRTDPWDPLKYIALRDAPGWYLTLAGEERSFYEHYRNYNWGAGPQDDNGYYLNRFLGSADFHLGSSTRFFFELESSLEIRTDWWPEAGSRRGQAGSKSAIYRIPPAVTRRSSERKPQNWTTRSSVR
jgi:hypothetical protein